MTTLADLIATREDTDAFVAAVAENWVVLPRLNYPEERDVLPPEPNLANWSAALATGDITDTEYEALYDLLATREPATS